MDAEYGKVFAKTEVELNGAKEPGDRTEETNMGDLITDAMMWAVKTRMPSINMENAVAITNGAASVPPSRPATSPRRTSTPCCRSATRWQLFT